MTLWAIIQQLQPNGIFDPVCFKTRKVKPWLPVSKLTVNPGVIAHTSHHQHTVKDCFEIDQYKVKHSATVNNSSPHERVDSRLN